MSQVNENVTVMASLANLVNELYKLQDKYIIKPSSPEFKEATRLYEKALEQWSSMLFGTIDRNTEEFKKSVKTLTEATAETKKVLKDLGKLEKAFSKARKALKWVDKAIGLLA